MIAAVSHYNIALHIQCNTAKASELPKTTALAAHTAHIGAVAHTQHLNTVVVDVKHEHVPAAINRNAAWVLELPDQQLQARISGLYAPSEPTPLGEETEITK